MGDKLLIWVCCKSMGSVNLRIENKSDLQWQGNTPEGWKRQNFFIWIGGQNRIKETHKNLQLKRFPII
jgi:hypothetical protein